MAANVIVRGRRIIVYASATVRSLHPLGSVLQNVMINHSKHIVIYHSKRRCDGTGPKGGVGGEGVEEEVVEEGRGAELIALDLEDSG
ncbi:hypothetical protein HYC85_021409 [Camellia sinensis]|uniref:Uncharacterized protein n=1 Tax=Camellia sinensis TaxID=4442 RepID=A0A7J7GHJ7_CAMSI|nr:hypothetical protein HYC85_021409 [Camellia sinensis]